MVRTASIWWGCNIDGVFFAVHRFSIHQKKEYQTPNQTSVMGIHCSNLNATITQIGTWIYNIMIIVWLLNTEYSDQNICTIESMRILNNIRWQDASQATWFLGIQIKKQTKKCMCSCMAQWHTRVAYKKCKMIILGSALVGHHIVCTCMYPRTCVHAYVCACMRACVRVCVRECMRACVAWEDPRYKGMCLHVY